MTGSDQFGSRIAAMLGASVDDVASIVEHLTQPTTKEYELRDQLRDLLGDSKAVTKLGDDILAARKQVLGGSGNSGQKAKNVAQKQQQQQQGAWKPIANSAPVSPTVSGQGSQSPQYSGGGGGGGGSAWQQRKVATASQQQHALASSANVTPVQSSDHLDSPQQSASVPKVIRLVTQDQKTQQSPQKQQQQRGKKAKKGQAASNDAESTQDGSGDGRKECGCQGLKHQVITNCLSCGRVLCEVEGAGDCFFCHEMVISREQQLAIMRSKQVEQALQQNQQSGKKKKMHKTSDNARRTAYSELVGGNIIPSAGAASSSDNWVSPAEAAAQLARDSIDASTAKAEAHKNKLLEFQRTSASRMKVIDEASDYSGVTEATKWMSPLEKIEAIKKRQRERQREADLEDQRRRGLYSMQVDLDVKGGVRYGGAIEQTAEPTESSQSKSSHKQQQQKQQKQQQQQQQQSAESAPNKGGYFARNPLKIEGIAPIYIPSPDKNAGKAKDVTKSTTLTESQLRTSFLIQYDD
ncbi:zf-C2HC5-domain-containing protein [Ramicandelaber brevisporus]|nr:zf-C2HC5-domain-containing protein [Ramicandelaber brevisporus]